MNEAASKVWAAFAEQEGLTDTPYQVWAFGVDPDDLADLVVRGIKTATSSAFPLYELEGEPLPSVGSYHIILDGSDRPRCIIRITNVEVVPFNQVTAAHAYSEGEGDRSLTYWRGVHEAFFSQNAADLGYEFTPAMPVVCETFEVVFLIKHI